MSPREPNDDWRVFSAISVVYGMAGRSFVNQVTSGRFFGRFSLRQGRQERVGDFRVDMSSANAGLGKDRRWVSNFSHGGRESPGGRKNPGGLGMAKDSGCRCWSMPWKNFPGPISAACRAMLPCWLRYAPSWRVRCHPAHMAHPVSACEIKTWQIRFAWPIRSGTSDRTGFIRRRSAVVVAGRARSRAAWLPHARCNRASSAQRPDAW
jgi:hypothetical protein